MTFDYSLYYRVYFLFPVALLVLCLIVLTCAAYRIIRLLQQGVVIRSRDLVQMACTVLVPVIFIWINCATLLSGGFWLCMEDESAVEESYGVISCIEEVGKYEVRIYIGDECYTALENITFSEGDYVCYSYLPKSGFLLEIQSAVP